MKTTQKTTAQAEPASTTSPRLTSVSLVPCLPALTPAERLERAQLEAKFKAAFGQALETLLLEAVPALRTFKERKLYRDTHHSWRAYCPAELGMSDRAIDYLLAYGDVYLELKKSNTCSTFPIYPSQLRPLLALKSQDRIGVWKRAVEESGQEQPTVALLRSLTRTADRDQRPVGKRLRKPHPQTPGADSCWLETIVLLLLNATLLADMFDRITGHERRRALLRDLLREYAQLLKAQGGHSLPGAVLDWLCSASTLYNLPALGPQQLLESRRHQS